MRILIISDTHGKLKRVYDVYNKLSKTSDIDLIVHCGDYYDDAMDIHKHLGKKVVAVRGNCDRCFDENEFTILETEAGNFFVCHGHMHNVKYNKQSIYYNAMQAGCTGAIFGHTHRAGKTELGDFVFINPGSITKPRDSSGGTFALLDTAEGYINARIMNYQEFMDSEDTPPPPASKPKVKSGFLRRIINYSDGL